MIKLTKLTNFLTECCIRMNRFVHEPAMWSRAIKSRVNSSEFSKLNVERSRHDVSNVQKTATAPGVTWTAVGRAATLEKGERNPGNRDGSGKMQKMSLSTSFRTQLCIPCGMKILLILISASIVGFFRWSAKLKVPIEKSPLRTYEENKSQSWKHCERILCKEFCPFGFYAWRKLRTDYSCSSYAVMQFI